MHSGYAYVYDDFLADRRYERDLAALETKLNTLDLFGPIGRMTLFRSAKDLIEGLVRQGAKTVVIVGNDASLEKTMWFLPDMDVVVGYLPLANPSNVGRLLGIPSGIAACNVLSARHIERLDLGRINDQYFLTEARVLSMTASLSIEGKYRMSFVQGGSLSIRNLGSHSDSSSDPRDGFLEAVATSSPREEKKHFWKRESQSETTRILFQSGEITSDQPFQIQVDHAVVSSRKLALQIESQKLRMITGRSSRMNADLANSRAK